MSNEAFKRNFSALMDRVREKQELVVRRVGLDLYSNLVMKSPVDTGRFRGNWQVGVGSVNTDTSAAPDPGGGGAIAGAAEKLKGAPLAGVIYFTNSLPYAKPLEYGHSKQAPQGMVRLTVVEYGNYLRDVVQQLDAQKGMR